MKRSRASFDVKDGNSGEPSKQRRKISENNDIFYVTKIKDVCLDPGIVSIIGRNSKGVRILWNIYKCYPYFYYRFNNSDSLNEKELQVMFTEIFSTDFMRLNIRIVDMKLVRGKPLRGYQDNPSSFLKISLATEFDRFRLMRYVRERKKANFCETNITMLERFCADTGIKVGEVLRAVSSDDAVNSFVYSMNWLQNDMDRIRNYYNMNYYDLLRFVGRKDEKVPNKILTSLPAFVITITSFKLISLSIIGEKRQPICMKTNEVIDERFLSGSDFQRNYRRNGGGDPIDMVLICKATYSLSDHKLVGIEKIILSKIKFDFDPSPIGFNDLMIFKDSSDRNSNKNLGEIEMLKCLLSHIAKSDFLVGFKITDSLKFDSLKYVFKRLIDLGSPKLFIDTSQAKNLYDFTKPSRPSSRTPPGKKAYVSKYDHIFKFTTIIDLYDYANSYYSQKGIVDALNCSFEHLKRYVEHSEDPSEFSSVKNWEVAKILTSKAVSHEQGMLKVDIMGKLFIDCSNKIIFVSNEQVVEKTLERSSEWNVSPERIWLSGQSAIFKGKMLRMLAQMKREDATICTNMDVVDRKNLCSHYVNCPTKNYQDCEPDSVYMFVDKVKNDMNRGGRTIKPTYNLVTNSSGTIDFSNNYPGIIFGAKLDFVNILFSKDGGKDLSSLTDKRILHGKIGKVSLGFVNDLPLNNLPLVRLLKEQYDKRCSLKNKIAKGQLNLKIKEEAVKKVMVSVTGCLSMIPSKKFQFEFSSFSIGETLRWMSRIRFDFAVNFTKTLKMDSKGEVYNFAEPVSLNVTEKRKNMKFYNIDVIAGHTDGFDIMVKKGKMGVDCPKQIFEKACTQICRYVEIGVDELNFGFKKNFKEIVSGPKLGIERLCKKIIYLNTNSKLWIDFDDKLKTKGTFANMKINCKVQRDFFHFVVRNVLLNESFEDFEDQRKEFRRQIKNFIRLTRSAQNSDKNIKWWLVDNFAKYERVTEKMHLAKFDLRKFTRYNVTRILRNEQKNLSFEIPSIDQNIGYIWVEKFEVVTIENFDPKIHRIKVEKYVSEMEDGLAMIENLFYE